MAQRTIIELVDDVDGTIISDGGGETVTFGHGGATYEIDLTREHAAELEAALAPWIARGRRVSAPPRKKPAGRSKEQTQQIRQWAVDSGYAISDRGRIPADVEAKFHESNGVPLKGKARPKSA